jgi:hypothetical protein
MVWILFLVPNARSTEPEIITSGPIEIVAAKLCFQDISERPGPPVMPVCFGPDEWGKVAAPDYPEMAVTLYLQSGKVGLKTAVYALKILAGVDK